MSAMADMSRAIRLEIEEHSTDHTLSGLPRDILEQHVQIVGAFYADLRDELKRREKEDE